MAKHEENLELDIDAMVHVIQGVGDIICSVSIKMHSADALCGKHNV